MNYFKIININNENSRSHNNIEIINLSKVAKINITYENRIILNFNHTICRVNSNGASSYSGYYYIDRDKVSNYDEIYAMLNSAEFIETFIPLISTNKLTGFINRNEISTIKISDLSLSVIFNLSHTVTDKNNLNNMSADSVVSTFSNEEMYYSYYENLLSELEL